MEPTAHTRRTALPGVGTRYDLETEAGRHLSVVVHHDGRRILAFHDPEDDDNCRDAAPLEPHEAAALV
ncbi:potassium transporter TrkA, partial [Streptomyces albidoflavus]